MKVAALVLLFYLLALTAVVHAHAELLTAVPAPGSTISNSISEIRLTFSEPIVSGSSILLFAEDFQPVASSMAQVTEDNAHILITTIPRLTPGDYTVQWTAVSSDGHPTSGSYTFRLTRFALPTPLVWQIALTLLFLGTFVILWQRNRKP